MLFYAPLTFSTQLLVILGALMALRLSHRHAVKTWKTNLQCNDFSRPALHPQHLPQRHCHAHHSILSALNLAQQQHHGTTQQSVNARRCSQSHTTSAVRNLLALQHHPHHQRHLQKMSATHPRHAMSAQHAAISIFRMVLPVTSASKTSAQSKMNATHPRHAMSALHAAMSISRTVQPVAAVLKTSAILRSTTLPAANLQIYSDSAEQKQSITSRVSIYMHIDAHVTLAWHRVSLGVAVPRVLTSVVKLGTEH